MTVFLQKIPLTNLVSVFNVITFPADHGTTPDSMVYIYEDNVLIKEIPFFDTYSNDEQFNLSNLNNQKVEKNTETGTTACRINGIIRYSYLPVLL